MKQKIQLSAFHFAFCVLLFAQFGCSKVTPSKSPVQPKEFRGAWIPTVNNIDWPSRPGLPVEEQKAELTALLDTANELNLNVVILQVRTACDALYESKLEPWSEYLTGTMGQAPEPYYDPLQFAIDEAHKRGLQLHAWLNPYRARYHTTLSEVSPNHISIQRPDLVRIYGKHLWLDPGEPEVQQMTIDVVLDVVRRYDVDGIHFDDYFYPYPEQDDSGNDIEFDDNQSWEKFKKSGSSMSRDDWRRQNVNTVVKRLYETIKAEKPHVMFGISPFGIWRPGNPEGIEGFDQFDSMWADPKLWLQEGWVEYLAPQLYWPTFQAPQDYEKLLQWWVGENSADRLLLVGNATYRVVDEPWKWGQDEYKKQMEITRQLSGDGNIHYYLGILQKNPELVEMLKEDFYQQPASLPDMPWMTE